MGMDIFNAGVDLLQGIVSLVGGSMVVFGFIQALMGFHEQNGVQRNAGITLFICGAGIAVAAMQLIPLLKNITL